MSHPSTSKDCLCRIVLLGDQSVGKSSYVNALFDQDFDSTYSPTVGVDYRARQISFSNKQSRIHIFDSSGHEELKGVSKSLYQYAEGFVFMYQIGERKTFESVKEWVRIVGREKKGGAKMILLGNKRDEEKQGERQVGEEEGRELAEIEGMGFYQISVKENYNIRQSICHLVTEIHKFQQLSRVIPIKQKKQVSFLPLLAFILLIVLSITI